ncbi:hypothetical protein [Rhizobium leguminosarum]|uniref:hypothetical protein n=1 Tax=Rhizobium leguminosarum TaxID=384 RepID=UPI0012DB70F6|nr:hypothetical protein [Rhizobium leguminosarum]
MKTVKVLKERKIADWTLLHLHGDDRSWRILAINIAAVAFGTAYRAWSMCEENTAYRPSARCGGRPQSDGRLRSHQAFRD